MSYGIVIGTLVIGSVGGIGLAVTMAVRDVLAERRWRLTPRARALAALGEAVQREVP